MSFFDEEFARIFFVTLNWFTFFVCLVGLYMYFS
jgi:hypothetical protein